MYVAGNGFALWTTFLQSGFADNRNGRYMRDWHAVSKQCVREMLATSAAARQATFYFHGRLMVDYKFLGSEMYRAQV
jgi:site-specific recombinase